jgi:hypothetical protein
MRTPILTALLIAATPLPAIALSCLRPDAVRLFEEARDSPDPFMIVHGYLHTDGPIALPNPDANGQYPGDATAHTTVRLSGQGLTDTGFTAPVNQDITLAVTCLVAWCGTPLLDVAIIAAIQLKDTGPELLVSPCEGWRAMRGTPEDARRVEECHRDGNCVIRTE